MISLNADDYPVDESVIDLINAFAKCLEDKDKATLDDVYYLAVEKITSRRCTCYEDICICDQNATN
jgi:hypothetical protein